MNPFLKPIQQLRTIWQIFSKRVKWVWALIFALFTGLFFLKDIVEFFKFSDEFLNNNTFVESPADGLVRGIILSDLKSGDNQKLRFYYTSADIDDYVYEDTPVKKNEDFCAWTLGEYDDYCPFSVFIDDADNILVNLTIRNLHNEIALEIIRGKAIINRNNLYTISCHEDSFEIKDQNGLVICYFKYIGNNQFMFRGLLTLKDMWIVYTDQFMYLTKNKNDPEITKSLSEIVPRLDASLDWCR